MAEQYREREDKYEVESGWQVPDLTTVLPPDGRLESDSVELTSTYFDTADHALLRHGITLRKRSGGGEDGWQLKVPDGAARTELRVPVTAGRAIPRELQDLIVGLRAGRPVRAVAKIDTHRGRTRVLDSAGATLAELADDRVSAVAMGDTALVSSWREVEVELGSGDELLLVTIGDELRAGGAQPARGPNKLTRALGDVEADLPVAATTAGRSKKAKKKSRPTETLVSLIGRYLDVQVDRILLGDLDLRRERDDIHGTRVATRRYRSVLRVFGDLFDAERAQALDAELAWYAGVLGEVRDLEVLRARLADSVHALPGELVLGPVAATIEETLLREQLAARKQLAAVLRSRRYLILLAELAAWQREVPWTPKANRPAAKVSGYLNRADRTLARRLRKAARPDAGDEVLHRARKAGKRARYTAEVAEPALGAEARDVVARAKDLQDQLGDHQDSVVAAGVLLRLGAAAGVRAGENGFTYGLLLAGEQQRAEQTRLAIRSHSLN